MVEFLILFLVLILVFVVLFLLTRINTTLNQKLKDVHSDYASHLTSSQGILSNITEKLTELKGATQNILEVGENIQSLQDILRPPKLRGALGELMLEQALGQVLPPKHYQTSYKFQTGDMVDAVVKLKDSQLICIDAKFPLDSIKNYIDDGKFSGDVPGQFVRDVKKHIDSISTKYILPKEGTLDFALMYVPAENVYYEIILKDEKLVQYAKEKHVVPVSPIGLYSYLSTILIGLKGMEVEKNAKDILSHIGDLKVGLDKFFDEFDTLGLHINNAKAKYDLSRNKITEISNKLKNIEVPNNE